jgi:carboxyl-terminal processing protease
MKKILLALTVILAFNFSQAQYCSSEGSKKFDALLQIVKYAYVDSVNEKKLVEDAIIGMFEKLDPHSVYIPKEELQQMNEPLEGSFEGVGIQFNILHDTLVVVSPIPGGPSEKVGIMPGDKIIKVDGKNIAGVGIKNSDVQKLLRGKKGTKVNVSILRHGEKELLDFTIIRDEIPIFSVDASFMIDDKTGYIKVNRFAKETITELEAAFEKLKKQNMQNLILDLQGNGGGYLKTAIDMADEFLNDKQLIVYTEGRTQPRSEYYSTPRGEFQKGKLIILIDEGSASASEIVSGAMQDHDRALIVGRRSFGKGLVQKPFGLPDGSAIRLTTARYYTPSGRSIQRSYEGGKKDYYNDLMKRYEHGELTNKDSIHFPDSLKYKTDHGRIVYGGGGIMPDVFVPLDTTKVSDYFAKIRRKGIMYEFILTYLDGNRGKLLAKYPTFNTFNEKYVADDILNKLVDFAQEKGIEKDDKGLEESKDILALNLKALLARNLYDNSAFYQIINELNDSYLKAIEIMNKVDKYFRENKISY